ncbi:hypothetical protein K438DRAFT_897454 [Mycena galopus ATCC 62051]|nr:hypothetical protein K438DRAFT_897454 [Mycena galopus ATCC 62051]
MTACPPTPVVRRRAPSYQNVSHPYMRFNADLRTGRAKEYPNKTSFDVTPTPKYPSFRRATSIRFSNSLTSKASKADASLSSHMYLSSSSSSSTPKPSFRPHDIRPEDSFHARSSKKENHASSPPFLNPPVLVSSPTVPFWTSNNRMVPIEEYDELDDDADGCPPISSSPDRSSDPFFPFHESMSSPRTSDPDSPILESDALPGTTTSDAEFVSKLHTLLAVAAKQHERHMEIDNAIAATLEDRSLSVTPDYCASPTPGYGKDVFGPRIAPRTYSSEADSAAYSCDCSDCARSRSTSQTGSIASTSTYAGYAADLDVSSPQVPFFSYALSNLRASNSANSATPAYHTISSNAVAPSLLKRSYSSLQDDYTTPPNRYPKKSRPISRPSSFSSCSKTEISDNTTLSRVPASLRKSLSLRSDASKKSLSPPYEDFLVATALNSPTPANTGRVIHNALLTIPFDVPIIAPPPEHIARLPLSQETSAKIRIGNFLAREGICRAGDKLDKITVAAAVSTLHAEEDEGRRELDRLEWEHILGIGPEVREQVVHWLLEVLPKKSNYFPPIKYASHRLSRSASDRSSSSFSSAHDFGDRGLPDLIDQLLYSPETRFHAAYMFARYWYLLMGDRKHKDRLKSMQEAAAAAEDNDSPDDPTVPSEGWNLVIWDSCLACLAISVKLHRDVLEPLEPVLSWEFEYMAPHQLSYDDLETAQRDVLETLQFRLGATPQPILDELWIALPSLRQLLEFENGWKFAQKQAWWRLFDAVAEPDVLKFPISSLTVAALAEALVAALVSKYEHDATVNNQVIRRRPNKNRPDSKKDRLKLETRAETEMEGVLQDIQAIIGISDQTLKACRTWIRGCLTD